jgi:hypothetical protein
MPGNCLSHLGRVETAATRSLQCVKSSRFAGVSARRAHRRPFLRGLDGEFWPAGESMPIGCRRPPWIFLDHRKSEIRSTNIEKISNFDIRISCFERLSADSDTKRRFRLTLAQGTLDTSPCTFYTDCSLNPPAARSAPSFFSGLPLRSPGRPFAGQASPQASGCRKIQWRENCSILTTDRRAA